MAIISVKDLSFSYQLTNTYALKNVTLDFEEGKTYGVTGLNGSGKTTLLNVIRGFIPLYFPGKLKGQITLYGKDLREYESGELALTMGYVFQNPFNQITGSRETVFEEIAFGLENFGIPREEILERVRHIMVKTNTEYLADRNPLDLSGGQQQRVALASVLVMNPSILIIDEPTSQLDPFESERVFSILNELKRDGKTIILVEHKIDLVSEFADEIIVLKNGQVVRAGCKEDVFTDDFDVACDVALPSSVALQKELMDRGISISRLPFEFDNVVSELSNL